MKKLVCGIGVNDADYVVQKKEDWYDESGKRRQRRVWACPFYDKWKNMLVRCYSEKEHEKRPNYKDCIVCEEWLTFSNFKKWMEDQDYIGKHLDKDLIEEGNKVYSPEKCLFLSPLVNTFMITRKNDRGKYLLGVSLENKSERFRSECSNPFTKSREYLGCFTSELDAHNKWKSRKLELAYKLSNLPENHYLEDLLIKRYIFEEDEICKY